MKPLLAIAVFLLFFTGCSRQPLTPYVVQGFMTKWGAAGYADRAERSGYTTKTRYTEDWYCTGGHYWVTIAKKEESK